MGFTAFVGRLLFASVFVLSAYHEYSEFGVNGGPAAKAFKPKFNHFTKLVNTKLWVQLPPVEIKHVIAANIALKGAGGILFALGSSLGAYLLLLHLAFVSPIVYDFYNYGIEKPEFLQLFSKFTQNLALFGALIFFLGMSSMPKRTTKKKAAPKAKAS